MGVVQFVNENKGMLQHVVGALFPGVEEAKLQGLGEEKDYGMNTSKAIGKGSNGLNG